MDEARQMIELGDETMYVDQSCNDLSRDHPDAFSHGICTTEQLGKLGLVVKTRDIIKDALDNLDTLRDDGAKYLVTESALHPAETVSIKSFNDLNQTELNVTILGSGNFKAERYWILAGKKSQKLYRPSRRPSLYPSGAHPSSPPA
jgi:hypothetical protein